MAAKRPLSILEKQKLLSGKSLSAESLKEWGDFYRGLGRIHDAIDMYERAGARSVLQEINRAAVASGDLFLFRRTLSAMGEEARPSDLEEVAARAAAKGMEAYARAARGEPAMPPDEPATTITVTAS